jgi:hypothetical protein
MHMSSWRRRLRSFALTWGVLQFVLPLAILFGDANSALSGSRRPIAHVESATTDSCQPVHADECALCRFLSHNNAPDPRAELPAVPASAGQAPCDAPQASQAAAVGRFADSRAPPIA